MSHGRLGHGLALWCTEELDNLREKSYAVVQTCPDYVICSEWQLKQMISQIKSTLYMFSPISV